MTNFEFELPEMEMMYSFWKYSLNHNEQISYFEPLWGSKMPEMWFCNIWVVLLVPSLNGQVKSGSDQTGPSGDDKTKHNFVLHWLNNKEMEFTVQAEKIMEDLLKMALEKDDVSAEAFEYEPTHQDKVLKQITVSQSKIQWPKNCS